MTLYGRAECHLCDEALEAIEAMRGAVAPFDLRQIDIEEDEGLLRAHLERIPVVEVDGDVVSELALDEAAVRAALTPSGG